jgi:lipopolysaccharide export system protein LptA
MADLPPVSSPYVCDSFATVREFAKDQVSRTCKISFLNTDSNTGGESPEAPVPAPAPSLTTPSALPSNAPVQKAPVNRSLAGGVIELRAEEQSYNSKEQIVTATGNVRVRFRNALLKADQVTVDIQSRKAVATGNVFIKRGEQILRGDKFDYDFGKDRGEVTSASGDVYQPTLERDVDIANKKPLSLPLSGSRFPEGSLADKLERDQPVTKIERRGATNAVIGTDREIEFQPPPAPPATTITRLRYRADKLEFDGKVLTGSGVRLTNDPFSPPELEVRADRATFKNIAPGQDQIDTSNARVTIEQNVNIPLVVAQFGLGKEALETNPFGVGFDNDERGGLFFERTFKLANDDKILWTLTPQYFAQRVIAQDKLTSLDSIGVKTALTANLAPGTVFDAKASLTSLEPSVLGNNLRSSLSLTQDLDLPTGRHKVVVDSAYRERVFNGTLGFQDLQSSLGIGITSPKIALGDTGINFDYNAGFRLLNAGTDRAGVGASDGRVNLGRFQMAANLNKSWRLWEGIGPDPNERSTYNYSPVPVVPYLQLNTGINAKVGSYTNGESQSLYGYAISLQGQIGHFTAPAFDYTGFNIGYSQGFLSGSSPFLFDRFLDTRVVSAGINQQLFGPLRAGIQTSINLDTNRQISTDYYLEYSRRTFSIVTRYNPVLQLGSIGFRINDLDWRGQADPF